MAAGELDSTFGTDSVVSVASDVAHAAMVAMRDGRIVVVHRPREIEGQPLVITLRRFMPDGTPDPSFGGVAHGQPAGTPAGTARVSGLEGLPFVEDVEVDPSSDGFFLAGLTTRDNDKARFGVLSVNGDGTINTDFGGPSRSPGDASPGVATVEFEGDHSATFRDMAVSQDGRLALLGDANLDGYLAMLSDSGRFARPALLSSGLIKWGDGVELQQGGVGFHTSYRGGGVVFGPDNLLYLGATRRDESLVAQEPPPPTETPFIRALEIDGRARWDHEIELPFLRSHLGGLVTLPDGGLLALTEDRAFQSALAKVTANGQADASFGTNGILTPFGSGHASREQRRIHALPDGRFYVMWASNIATLKRFLPDGSPDPTFVETFPFSEDDATTLDNDFGVSAGDDVIILTVRGARDPSGNSAGDLTLRQLDGSGMRLTPKGTLLLGGTSGADQISVTRRYRDGRILAVVNDHARVFLPHLVKRIQIYAHGGDDVVTIGPDVRSAYLHGGDGDDTLTGGDGNDWLQGALGNDSLTGGLGDDTLEGNAGNDYVLGSAGHDQLFGHGGRDTLLGTRGNDRLFGGPNSADFISGGDGTDSAADDPLDTYAGVEHLLS
jgi:Ca2+-binding RTX toxin-like protein